MKLNSVLRIPQFRSIHITVPRAYPRIRNAMVNKSAVNDTEPVNAHGDSAVEGFDITTFRNSNFFPLKENENLVDPTNPLDVINKFFIN
jgi:hypothetical protein